MWRRSRPSDDRTHHLVEGSPLYRVRFDEVLPFHPPGLAPVRTGEQWRFIRATGRPAFRRTFDRAFGFYEGVAAVQKGRHSYHVDVKGRAAYTYRFSWCGNFQERRCAVRTLRGAYRHITRSGSFLSTQEYVYAGDFREGTAVVFTAADRCHHVDLRGERLYAPEFIDLGTFHKGIAPARDQRGWFHIDRRGRGLYEHRFASVEPFYNGVSWAARADGERVLVEDSGHIAHELPLPQGVALNAASEDLTAYWRSLTLVTALRRRLFHSLPGSTETVASCMRTEMHRTESLLRALADMGYLRRSSSGPWRLTPLGASLSSYQADELEALAIHWSSHTADAWSRIDEWLGSRSAPADGGVANNLFTAIRHSPKDVEALQRALGLYARQDYIGLAEGLDIGEEDTILDAGGGTGSLLRAVLERHPQARGILLERPEVVRMIKRARALPPRTNLVSADLLHPWPCRADIVILAKVLHDWGDGIARRILSHARVALRRYGSIYVVERLVHEGSSEMGLLSLHLQLIGVGGHERGLRELTALARASGLRLVGHSTLPSGFHVLRFRPQARRWAGHGR